MELSRETKSVLVGTLVVISVSLLCNLVLGYELVLTSIIGVVLGIITGFIANKLHEKISLFLEIIGWGLISTALIFIILKLLGVVHSPTGSALDTLLTTGILASFTRWRSDLVALTI